MKPIDHPPAVPEGDDSENRPAYADLLTDPDEIENATDLDEDDLVDESGEDDDS